MKTSYRWLAMVAGVLLAACPPPNMGEDDGGDEPEVPFDGETMGSVIPVFDPEAIDAGDPVIDAGMVTVETRCCQTQFAISDQEPADAVGVLEGQNASLSTGVALARSDAGWTASACFPLAASAYYWYRFTYDGGFIDAGEIDVEDGGIEISVIHVETTVIRASESEPSFTGADGVTKNYFRSVDTCDGLDGGVPR